MCSPKSPKESFKDFVLDQLRAVPDLRAKAMFGGYGLYQGDLFFGIVMDGRLYFKASEEDKRFYVERGMGPFTVTQGPRKMSMSYYEVPADVVENRESLLQWAARAFLAGK